MLPEFGGLTSWAQQNGADALITVLAIVVVVLLIKREMGSLIGVVVVVALLIVIIRNPDATIVRMAQGLVNKLMGTAGG